MKIFNVQTYGIAESLIRAGYPMQTVINDRMDIPIASYGLTAPMLSRGIKLGNADSGHSNFLKGIIVQADFEASQYWWLQAQRYQFFTLISSQSKMHKITEMNLSDLLYSGVCSTTLETAKGFIQLYKEGKCDFEDVLNNIPMGLEYSAGVSTNYMCLKNMYNQRKNHRLVMWNKIFVEFCEALPLFKEFCLGGNNNDRCSRQ